jgi:hypothetical protein
MNIKGTLADHWYTVQYSSIRPRQGDGSRTRFERSTGEKRKISCFSQLACARLLFFVLLKYLRAIISEVSHVLSRVVRCVYVTCKYVERTAGARCNVYARISRIG